jgi:hypothetical protein
MEQKQPDHGCMDCYDINEGFHLLKSGKKQCDSCGGTVLFLQEAFDHIAELDSTIREYQEIYE